MRKAQNRQKHIFISICYIVNCYNLTDCSTQTAWNENIYNKNENKSFFFFLRMLLLVLPLFFPSRIQCICIVYGILIWRIHMSLINIKAKWIPYTRILAWLYFFIFWQIITKQSNLISTKHIMSVCMAVFRICFSLYIFHISLHGFFPPFHLSLLTYPGKYEKSFTEISNIFDICHVDMLGYMWTLHARPCQAKPRYANSTSLGILFVWVEVDILWWKDIKYYILWSVVFLVGDVYSSQRSNIDLETAPISNPVIVEVFELPRVRWIPTYTFNRSRIHMHIIPFHHR